MGRAQHDAILVGHGPVALHLEERHRALVHRRPNGIGTQAQQQFKYLLIRARPDASRLCRRFEVGRTPGIQPPVFIIEENTTELDVGTLLNHQSVGQPHLVAPLRTDIGPPGPGRHADQPRQFQHPIGSAARIAAGHHPIAPAVHLGLLQMVSLPLAAKMLQAQAAPVHKAVERGILPQRPDHDAHGAGRLQHFGRIPTDLPGIGGIERQGRPHHLIPAGIIQRRGASPADEVERGIGNQCGERQAQRAGPAPPSFQFMFFHFAFVCQSVLHLRRKRTFPVCRIIGGHSAVRTGPCGARTCPRGRAPPAADCRPRPLPSAHWHWS